MDNRTCGVEIAQGAMRANAGFIEGLKGIYIVSDFKEFSKHYQIMTKITYKNSVVENQ